MTSRTAVLQQHLDGPCPDLALALLYPVSSIVFVFLERFSKRGLSIHVEQTRLDVEEVSWINRLLRTP